MTDTPNYTRVDIETLPIHTLRLIGIGGKLGSGKDTVADHLVDAHQWVKIGMSDPLLEAMTRADPIIEIKPEEPLNTGKRNKYLRTKEILRKIGYVEAKKIEDFRVFLQKLGTQVGRDLIDENVWVNVADQMIQDYLVEGKNVILTGVRFPNEINLINKYENGETWYVKRDVGTDGDRAAHASETSVSEDDFTVVIENNNTLDNLYETVDALVGKPRPQSVAGLENILSEAIGIPADRIHNFASGDRDALDMD